MAPTKKHLECVFHYKQPRTFTDENCKSAPSQYKSLPNTRDRRRSRGQTVISSQKRGKAGSLPLIPVSGGFILRYNDDQAGLLHFFTNVIFLCNYGRRRKSGKEVCMRCERGALGEGNGIKDLTRIAILHRRLNKSAHPPVIFHL